MGILIILVARQTVDKFYSYGGVKVSFSSDMGRLIEADVLVIGGGLAGCNAAIAAAERGCRVVVSDKGKIERSGDIGGGVDHFMAF